jgi:hypothetical protein
MSFNSIIKRQGSLRIGDSPFRNLPFTFFAAPIDPFLNKVEFAHSKAHSTLTSPWNPKKSWYLGLDWVYKKKPKIQSQIKTQNPKPKLKSRPKISSWV